MFNMKRTVQSAQPVDSPYTQNNTERSEQIDRRKTEIINVLSDKKTYFDRNKSKNLTYKSFIDDPKKPSKRIIFRQKKPGKVLMKAEIPFRNEEQVNIKLLDLDNTKKLESKYFEFEFPFKHFKDALDQSDYKNQRIRYQDINSIFLSGKYDSKANSDEESSDTENSDIEHSKSDNWENFGEKSELPDEKDWDILI